MSYLIQFVILLMVLNCFKKRDVVIKLWGINITLKANNQ